MASPQKYDPDLAAPYYTGHNWHEASKRAWPGVSPNNTQGAKHILDARRRAAAPAEPPAGDAPAPEPESERPAEREESRMERLARLEREHRERMAEERRAAALEEAEDQLRVIPQAGERTVNRKRPRRRETAVLLMSDLYWGKKTATFDRAILRARLEAFGEKLAGIRELLGGEYEFDELRIALLGDANDGSGIYPTQAFHQDQANVEMQARELAAFLAPWLRAQKGVWGSLSLDCVPGNHGRSGKFAHEAASWDIVAYRYLADRLGDAVPLRMNERGNVFMLPATLYGWRFLWYHGHSIKMHMSIPWYGLQRRLNNWSTTSQYGPIDVAASGHFHTLGCWQLNRIISFLTGTAVSDDDWSVETLGYESATRWWIFGASPQRPVTWQFALDIGPGPKEGAQP